MPLRVLITGSAGRLGRAAVAELLARGHHVIGFDRIPTPGLPVSIIANVTDAVALEAAVDDVDCLIHLAASPDDAKFPRGNPPDDGDNFIDELVPNNVMAPYYVMEAARKANVGRVILASTGQVVDGHLRAERIPVNGATATDPRYLYACTKVFLEALGHVYAKQHGMTVLAVRLGWCPRDLGQVAEIQSSELGQDVYLSPNDAGRFFACAVEAIALPPFSIVYATSQPTHCVRYDLAETTQLTGYAPQERWPTGSAEFAHASR